MINVELNDVNSGSFRVYVAHRENEDFQMPYHVRQIGDYRSKSLLEYEKKLQLLEVGPYLKFFKRVEDAKRKMLELFEDIRRSKKTIIGYGASTKGNTLLQFYGINSTMLPAIADRSPEKLGKKTVGTWIPIISEEEARRRKPDYLFVLPWHFIDSFRKREKELLRTGTRLIVPLPYPHILEN